MGEKTGRASCGTSGRDSWATTVGIDIERDMEGRTGTGASAMVKRQFRDPRFFVCVLCRLSDFSSSVERLEWTAMRKSDKKKEARTSVKGDKKAEVVSPARSNTNAAAKPVNAALTAPPAMQITVGGEQKQEGRGEKNLFLRVRSSTDVAVAGNKFALTHGLLVNNPEYADVSVILAPSGGKKETLAAHEAFLSFRGVSGLLSAPSALCSKIEKKGGHTTAVVSESALAFCNSAILLAVLRFVYTSDVKSVESSDDLAFLVNLLATVVAAGLGESYLARVVEDRVSSLTTLATAHTLIARTYDYKLDRLHYHTRSFAFRNWNAFISDKDGCRKLGVELLSKLSAANAKGETEIAPTFPVPALQDKILTDLAGMVASANGTADVAIECGKDSFAPAHRAVLATVCEGFRSDLIQAAVSSPKQRKSTSGKLEVSFASNNGADSLSVAGANALLQFVYFGNSAITAPVAVNLILALSDYKIASLEAACELAIQEFDLHTAFPILGITFHPNWVTRPTSGCENFYFFVLTFFINSHQCCERM